MRSRDPDPENINSEADFQVLKQRQDQKRVNKCFKMNKRNKQSLILISNRNDTLSESATTVSNDPMQSQSSHATAGADSPIFVTLGAEPTQCS